MGRHQFPRAECGKRKAPHTEEDATLPQPGNSAVRTGGLFPGHSDNSGRHGPFPVCRLTDRPPAPTPAGTRSSPSPDTPKGLIRQAD